MTDKERGKEHKEDRGGWGRDRDKDIGRGRPRQTDEQADGQEGTQVVR